LYDDINRSGLIQARLRAIHRNLKTTKPPDRPRQTPLKTTGGPKPKQLRLEPQDYPPNCDELIRQLNSTCAKSGVPEIKKLMVETFAHRQHLRHSNDTNILKIYRKFQECDFMVN